MLQNILGLVNEFVGAEIAKNTNIPAEQKADVVQTVVSTMGHGLQSQIASVGLSSITSMLTGGGNSLASNPIVGQIQQMVVSALSQKLNINPAIANGIASSVVPSVINAISHKISDPGAKEFSVDSVVNAFTGSGGSKGIMNVLGGLFGK